jgi:glycosyltransferase involved in cell wall biosynthesis
MALVPLRRGRWLAWTGIALGAAIPLVTLSRTNIAVVLFVVALAGGRAITWRWPRLVLPIGLVAILVGGTIAAIGFRFIDQSTSSGEQRFDRLSFAVEHLDDGFVSGLDQVVDGEFVQSPHNTVLDLWLGGGFLAGLAGLVLLGLVGWWTTKAAVGTIRASTPRELHLQAATLGLLVIALARILAGGGGLLDPVAWFGLGVGVVLVGVPERLADFGVRPAPRGSLGDQPHIVLTMVSPLAYGAGRVVCEYAGALRESGYRVTVAYDHGGDSGELDRPTVMAELDGLDVGSVRIPGLSGPRSLRPGGQVERAVVGLAPDLLVATQLRSAGPTVSLGRRVGLETVVLVQNLPRFGGSRPVQLVKRTIYDRALTDASLVICVAQQVADELSEHYGVDTQRLAVVSNGIDPGPEPSRRRPDRREIRAEFGVEDSHHLIVNIGRVHPQKGHVHLIEAARRLRERPGVGPFTVIVVGGAESGATERLATQLADDVERLGLSDRVRFLGYRTDTRDLLECADVFVLSSLWEGGPSLAALEAMAAECPVVLTDYGSRLEGFVDGEHGFYVPAGDPEAMAEALHEIMGTSDEDLIAMGEAARAYVVEHRSLERARRSFVARLDQLLQAAP